MSEHRVGIIMHGVTGRMGTNQHLIRSILAIRNQGGVKLKNGTSVIPDPILVGRNEDKLRSLAEANGIQRWTTDIDAALKNKDDIIFFDAASTQYRPQVLKKAIAAGKHVYSEKPLGTSLEEALELCRVVKKAGVKHGVVQDKLWLPGLQKLKMLSEAGFFGRILSMKGDFGYWVFEGELQKGQRPSWNYRKEDGGGMILDMLCHWRYVVDNIVAPIKSVSCLGAIHIPQRWDEEGKPYQVTADDAAYATFELEGGAIAQINSSWCTRVRRDDLLTLQIDGTQGSAVAGLIDCVTQSKLNTPKPIWNPEIKQPIDFYHDWKPVFDDEKFENAFKVQWELFLKHVCEDAEFSWDFVEGAKGVQLVDLGLKSWSERRWVDVAGLKI